MSKLVGRQIPQDVRTAFDGSNLAEKIGPAYLLCTIDVDGSPRLSMLSVGEILAVNDETIRFALWPGTETGANVRQGRPVVLCYVAPETVYYLRGKGRGLHPVPGTDVDRVEVKVEAVESDVHPGLPVTGPITYVPKGVNAGTLVADWSTKLEVLAAPETSVTPAEREKRTSRRYER